MTAKIVDLSAERFARSPYAGIDAEVRLLGLALTDTTRKVERATRTIEEAARDLRAVVDEFAPKA